MMQNLLLTSKNSIGFMKRRLNHTSKWTEIGEIQDLCAKWIDQATTAQQVVPLLQSVLSILQNASQQGSALLKDVLDMVDNALQTAEDSNVAFVIKFALLVLLQHRASLSTPIALSSCSSSHNVKSAFSATQPGDHDSLEKRVVHNIVLAIIRLTPVLLFEALDTIKKIVMHTDPFLLLLFLKELTIQPLMLCDGTIHPCAMLMLIVFHDDGVVQDKRSTKLGRCGAQGVPVSKIRRGGNKQFVFIRTITLKLIQEGHLTFAIISYCFDHPSFYSRGHCSELFAFAKMLFLQNHTIWAHDLFLQLFYHVRVLAFQIDVITFLLQQCTCATTTNPSAEAAAWTLLALIDCINTTELSTCTELCAFAASTLIDMIVLQESQQQNLNWELKSLMLLLACAKMHSASHNTQLFLIVNQLLFSIVPKDQILGASLVSCILKNQYGDSNIEEGAPFSVLVQTLLSLQCSVLSNSNSLSVIVAFHPLLAGSHKQLSECTFKILLDKVTSYVRTSTIYFPWTDVSNFCASKSHFLSEEKSNVCTIFPFCSEQSPINIESFVNYISSVSVSNEDMMLHARAIPLVLECLVKLRPEAEQTHFLEQLLSGGFCVATDKIEKEAMPHRYFIFSLLRAILTHLTNLLFKHHNMITPLLFHCINTIMDLTNSSITFGKLTLSHEEKQRTDLAFGKFTHVDIRLLIATVVSSKCSDVVTKGILQQIESHFFRLCTHQFQLEVYSILSGELDSIRSGLRLGDQAQHSDCDQLSFIAWLIGNISVLAERITQCREDIHKQIQKEQVEEIPKLKHSIQQLVITMGYEYILINMIVQHSVDLKPVDFKEFGFPKTSMDKKTNIEVTLQSLLLLQAAHMPLINFDELYSLSIQMFLQSQDGYLALILLETVARLCRTFYNNFTADSPYLSLSALVYVFLTTSYPTTHKELQFLFCHLMAQSAFIASPLWAHEAIDLVSNACNCVSVWYSIIALFTCLPRNKWLGVLTQMSDALGERVVLLTQPKAHQETDDVKIVHYRGISDANLPHAIAALLHVCAKKILLTEDSLIADKCKVLLQVILDSLCSYLDFSALYPAATPAIILVVGQLVLDVIFQKLSSLCPPTEQDKKKQTISEVLGVCKHVGMKVKAIVLVNDKVLAIHAKFSHMLALCEHFLKYLTDLSKMWNCPIHSSDTFLFSVDVMCAMNGHFELLVAGAVEICPSFDVDGDINMIQEDEELMYEMQQLREG